MSHLLICTVQNFIILFLVTQSCPTLWHLMDNSLPVSSVHGDSPSKNTGVGCHALSSRGSSQPMDQTQVSCVTGRFFTSQATRDTFALFKILLNITITTFDMQLNNIFFYDIFLSLFMLCFCLLVRLINLYIMVYTEGRHDKILLVGKG